MAIASYILDSFDPYERYYATTHTMAGTIRYTSVAIDNGVWWYATDTASMANDANFRTMCAGLNNSLGYYRGKFRPKNYKFYVGNQFGTTGNGWNIATMSKLPIPEANRFKEYYTDSNGNVIEYVNVCFNNDSASMWPVEHAGDIFLMDPYQLASNTISPKSLYYHQLFFQGEQAAFYDAGTGYDNFGNAPWPSSPPRANRKITPSNFWRPSVVQDTNTTVTYKGTLPSQTLMCSLNLEVRYVRYGIGNIQNVLYQYLNGLNFVSRDRCVIPSFCGLYTDAAGNRYDYLQLSNNSGYYTPVESLTNQLPMSQITTDTGGLLTGRIFSLMPSVDVLSKSIAQVSTLQAQLASQTAAAATAQATAVAAQKTADQAAQTAAVAAAVAAQNTTDQAAQTAAVTAQAAADQAILTASQTAAAAQLAATQAADAAQLAATQSQLDAANATLASTTQQLGNLTDTGSIDINLFGIPVSITKEQAISTGIFAGCAAGIGAVIAFWGVIFV